MRSAQSCAGRSVLTRTAVFINDSEWRPKRPCGTLLLGSPVPFLWLGRGRAMRVAAPGTRKRGAETSARGVTRWPRAKRLPPHQVRAPKRTTPAVPPTRSRNSVVSRRGRRATPELSATARFLAFLAHRRRRFAAARGPAHRAKRAVSRRAGSCNCSGLGLPASARDFGQPARREFMIGVVLILNRPM